MSTDLQYEENEAEFVVKMSRKNAVIDPMLGIVSKGVVLTFPKNYNFIKHLPQPHVNRIIKHGWNIDKTIFLEIPHVTTFHPTFDPALIQYWCVCVLSKKIIFRTIVLTKGYVSNADQIELEDSIIHESLHISEDEPIYLKGGSKQANYDETEKLI